MPRTDEHTELRGLFAEPAKATSEPQPLPADEPVIDVFFYITGGRHVNNLQKKMSPEQAAEKNQELDAMMISGRWVLAAEFLAGGGTESNAPLAPSRPAPAPVAFPGPAARKTATGSAPAPHTGPPAPLSLPVGLPTSAGIKLTLAGVGSPPAPDGTTWSHYQESIFEFLRTGEGDGIVGAVAGSGKTTTLRQTANIVTVPAIFIAFNKHIADALNEKLKGTAMGARTCHSLGLETVTRSMPRKPELKDNKYRGIIKDELRFRKALKETYPHLQQHIQKLAQFVRLTLTGWDSVERVAQMCQHYGLDFEPEYMTVLQRVMDRGDEMAKSGIIDFTDMVWLVSYWNLQPDTFGFVAVDECQDLNAGQLDLVLKMRAPGGRMLFVGDVRQAIMGFAGADDRSYYAIRERTGARELPLNICYRCPESHIALAQSVVPYIEARPGAPTGEVRDASDEVLADEVQAGDLVLCRRNAPLLKHAMRLIRRRMPARVRGRDVGRELANLVLEIGEDARDFSKFLEVLGQYEAKQQVYLEQKDAPESMFEVLSDKCEAVRHCYEGFKAEDPRELAEMITNIFSDVPDEHCIWLSSIHRSKGLENPRVFILEAEKLGQGHPRQKAHEMVQEQNLKYVALTRAKESLILMSSAGISGLLPAPPPAPEEAAQAAAE